jgi:Protein of unknown function (DUF2924)
MVENVAKELADLDRLTTSQLVQRYSELYGQPVRSRHRAYLIRKVAWRIQALAEGDLSERARRRAEELANDADVRVMPPRALTSQLGANCVPTGQCVATVPIRCDPRLPASGTAIVRKYKGRTIRVIVLADGFEYEGERFKTLTAVAKAITGSHMNGFRFFRLEGKT